MFIICTFIYFNWMFNISLVRRWKECSWCGLYFRQATINADN